MSAARAEVLVIGMDEKINWNETAGGRLEFTAPGNDAIAVFDIATDPARPRLLGTLAASNSIFGPPSSIVVASEKRLALVADAMRWLGEGATWRPQPNDSVHLVALDGAPRLAGSLVVGPQPSGMSIDATGRLAAIGLRAGQAAVTIALDGGQPRVAGRLELGEPIAHVALTPDGRRALAVRPQSARVSLLDVAADGTLRAAGVELPTGAWPYNAVVSPDGRLAVVANGGNASISDGSADTISVIDLAATPPRVVDHLVVGDGPEGIAFSPDGRHVAVVVHRGSNAATSDWFYTRNGTVVIFAVREARLVRMAEIELGRFPEPVAFSNDGRHLYVANVRDRTLQVLRIDDAQVTLGMTLDLPGQPAAMGAGR